VLNKYPSHRTSMLYKAFQGLHNRSEFSFLAEKRRVVNVKCVMKFGVGA